MKAKIALILSFMITISVISYFSVINAVTPSSVHDTYHHVTDISETMDGARESALFSLSKSYTNQTTQSDLSTITNGNIYYIEPGETPPAGHGWSNIWSVKTAPTCTQPGEEMMFCNGCNDICIRILPALGHDLHTATSLPTCTTDGSEVTTCSRCDYSNTNIIPALGHDLSTSITQPGCTTDGSEVTTCSRCDYSHTNILPALGHDLSTSITQPGCITDGSEVTTCSRCDYSHTNILPALGHVWNQTIVEPTCTQEGRNTIICTVCHEEHISSIPALGHHLETVTIQPTDTQNGSIITACTLGDYQTTEILPKLEIHTDLVISNQVSNLSKSLAAQLQVLSEQILTMMSPPTSLHGPNALDAVFGALSIVVMVAGAVILYPYFTLFQWVNQKKKAAIKNIFGGKAK